MNSSQIYNKAIQAHQKLRSQDNQYRNDLINELSILSDELSSTVDNKQMDNYYRHLRIIKLQDHIKHDQHKLDQYKSQEQDREYIVICPWTENDLSDSNEDLVTQKNMQSWRYNGCKVYGKAGNEPYALNNFDNRGFFAEFNYPINIVKNPSIFFFNPIELRALYTHIASNNPSLKDVLLNVAVKGTLTVGDFKKRFKLDAKSLQAELAKLKRERQEDIPDTTITKLQDYYQWELKQRQSYSGGDLSEYSDVTSDNSDFNSDLKNYKIYGRNDSDFFSDNSDINSDNYTPSDIENGMNYNGYTPSDIAAGIKYDDVNVSDMNEDE